MAQQSAQADTPRQAHDPMDSAPSSSSQAVNIVPQAELGTTTTEDEVQGNNGAAMAVAGTAADGPLAVEQDLQADVGHFPFRRRSRAAYWNSVSHTDVSRISRAIQPWVATRGLLILMPAHHVAGPANCRSLTMKRRESTTTSLSDSIFNYRKEHGRTYHAYKDGKYIFPNDEVSVAQGELRHL